MTILRVSTRERFTVVDRRTINDDRLSYRARGVLVWLLDKPDNWTVNSRLIARQGTEGRDALRTALKELEEFGYIERTPVQNEQGQWANECLVREYPDGWEPVPEKPEPGNPAPGNQALRKKTEEQKTEERSLRTNTRATFEKLDVLADLLADMIEENGSVRPIVTEAWLDQFRLMMKVEKRSPEEIEAAIRWSQQHHFWYKNILSPAKLRKHFDRLKNDARDEKFSVPGAKQRIMFEKLIENAEDLF